MSDVLLVAGSRLDLAGCTDGDFGLEVRFRAVRDVHYALYGYFSEASDLAVACVEVTLDELEEEASSQPFEEDVAISTLAAGAVGASASQSSALVLGRPASLEVPVSQDCTLRQLRSREILDVVDTHSGDSDMLRLWSEVVCRKALIAYGATQPGLRGLILGGASALLAGFTSNCGMVLREVDWIPEQGLDALAANGHVDFLVSLVDLAEIDEGKVRFEILAGLLARLLVGGLALICVRYIPDVAISGNMTVREAQSVTRNEIGQWILRLIGAGFSAAPLAFAPVAELTRDEAGRAAIVLVVRRL